MLGAKHPAALLLHGWNGAADVLQREAEAGLQSENKRLSPALQDWYAIFSPAYTRGPGGG